MALSQVLIDGEDWELVAEGFKFTEGPAVDAGGVLYFTDIPNNRIHRLTNDGKAEVFVEDSGGANGLMFGGDGRLYACQNALRKIVAFDSAGEAHQIADDVNSNDLVVTRAGAIYFTDPDHQQVWYISPEGDKRVVDKGIARPNGIILWPTQGTLVVADTKGPYLWTFRIDGDGTLSCKERYYTLRTPEGQTESGADGMTVDVAGRVYVTTKVGLQMFDPTGRLSGVIRKPQNAWLSNVVFGGPNLDTLYVTSGDKIFRRKTKTGGVLFFQNLPQKSNS